MQKNNKLNLIDTLLLAMMLALLMVGGHQTFIISKAEGFKVGFFKSYWIFMLVFILTTIYHIRKNKREKKERDSVQKTGKDAKNLHKKGRKL